MRPLETFLVLAVAVGVVSYLRGPRDDRRHRFIAPAVAGVAILQFFGEPFRWQLVPAYGVAAVLVALAWVPPFAITRPRLRLSGWVGAGVVAVLLPVLVPIPALLTPDGPYAVGTTTTVLIDTDRSEQYGPTPGSSRVLPVHIWYPADPFDQAAPGWLDRATAGAVAHEFGLPGFFLDHLTLTETHAAVDTPFVSGAGRFPVVVYSHGWRGFGRISPDQPERLASHGYVVIAPDHTYGALVADGPDGPIPLDPTALPNEDDVSEEAFDAAGRVLVATFAADIRFIFDSLPQLEPNGIRLAARLDLDRIGVYGHSTGGGAAVAACAADARCDAVLGLDPWVEPVAPGAIDAGLAQPFLAIRSEPWVELPNDEVVLRLHEAGVAPSTMATLIGAIHYDFVSLSQISPLAGVLGFKGPIPGARAQEIIGVSLVDFFDRFLAESDAEPGDFEELRIDRTRP